MVQEGSREGILSTWDGVVQLAWQSRYDFCRHMRTRLLVSLVRRIGVSKERLQRTIMLVQETKVMWLEAHPNAPQGVFLKFAAYS